MSMPAPPCSGRVVNNRSAPKLQYQIPNRASAVALLEADLALQDIERLEYDLSFERDLVARPHTVSTDRSLRRTNGARTAQAPVRFRRARTAHRYADDADSSREASSGLRHQPEHRARNASRSPGEERR